MVPQIDMLSVRYIRDDNAADNLGSPVNSVLLTSKDTP